MNLHYIYNHLPFILGITGIIFISTIFFENLRFFNNVKVKKRVVPKISRYTKILEYIKSKRYLSFIHSKIRLDLGIITATNEKNNSLRTVKLMLIYIGSIIISITICFITKDILSLFALFGVIIIPLYVFSFLVIRARKKLKDEFISFVSVFTLKYTSSKNVRRALTDSIPEVGKRIGSHISRLVNVMNSNNFEQALNDFDKRMDYVMASNFIAIIDSAQRSSKELLPSLIDLENHIISDSTKIKTNDVKFREKRNTIFFWIIVNISIYLIYFINKGLGAYRYFLYNPTGQNMLVINIGLIIVSLIALALEKRF